MATAEVMPTNVSEERIHLITTKRNGLLERANALVINSPETEKLAWDLINGIGELKKSIEDDFEPTRKAAYEAYQAVLTQKKGHLDNLVQPDKIVRDKLSNWEKEKLRIQAEQEKVAREAAEAERQRLQAIADEEARIAHEKAKKEAEDKVLREAAEAQAAGKTDVAEAILNTPVVVPPTPVAPVVMVAPTVVPSIAAQKVEGAGSMIEVWDFEITNESLIPREYLMVNMEAIGAVVDALKTKTPIPGIRVFSKHVPRRAAKRK